MTGGVVPALCRLSLLPEHGRKIPNAALPVSARNQITINA